jgi:hypothetical protein
LSAFLLTVLIGMISRGVYAYSRRPFGVMTAFRALPGPFGNGIRGSAVLGREVYRSDRAAGHHVSDLAVWCERHRVGANRDGTGRC